MENVKDEKALSYAVELALKRHEEERKRTENLNNRANNLIGYAVALGSLYFGIVSTKFSNSTFLIVITFLVFLIEFLVIVLCLYSNNTLLLKRFLTGPGGKILTKSAKDMSESDLKYQILVSYTNAYDTTYKRNIISSNVLKWSSILFAFGFLLGFVGIITQFTCNQ